MKTLLRAILTVLAIGLACTSADARHYTITTFDVPDSSSGANYADTVCARINNAGQISGTCGDNSQQIWHGFLYKGGQFTIIDVPGAVGKTQVYGMAATGKVAGYYTVSGISHGFTYDKGTQTFFYPLDVPGATNTFAFAINSLSKVVGYCWGITVGFLYDGSYHELIGPEADITTALGINDAGEIFGYYSTANLPAHGYILKNGQYTTIDYPQAKGTILYGNNTAGLIVGAQQDSSNNMHGFVYDGRTFTTIEPPGAVSSWAMGINDLGQIVGCYLNQNNHWHGFIAKPNNGLSGIYKLLLFD